MAEKSKIEVMVRKTNEVSVPLSPQAIKLLDELTAQGIYGRTREEVACRFIDKALQEFVEMAKLQI